MPEGAGMLDVRHRSLSREVAIRRVPFARVSFLTLILRIAFFFSVSACGLLSSTTLATLYPLPSRFRISTFIHLSVCSFIN